MESSTGLKLPCILALLVTGWITVTADMIFLINPPGDITLLRGSNLELNCTVDNSSYDEMEIEMRICHPNKTCFDINESLVTRYINDEGNQTLTLRKSNVTFEDSGNYECFYGNDFQNIKAVKVVDLPDKPVNISCISYNFNGLQCTATLIQGPSDLPLNWTLKYVLDGDSEEVTCKKESETLTCQQIRHALPSQTYLMTFTGASSINASWVVKEKFSVAFNYNIVKPGPVDHLKVSLTDNSRRVEVTWQVNNQLFASNMMLAHRIKLVSLQGWEEPRTLYMRNFKLKQYKKDLILYITDLIPNANYTVYVSSKPEGALGEQYWSNPANYTFTTNISIPGESVAVTNGSFLYIPGEDDTANIVLYWRNPSIKVSHGEINKYKVEIIEHSNVGYNTETASELDELNVTVATLPDDVHDMNRVYMEVLMIEERIHDEDSHNLSIAFNKSSAYTIKVWAGNDAGFSTETAVIGIPLWAQVKDLLPRWVLAEVDEQLHRTLVSWDDENGKFENITMVTVFSCRDNDGMTSSCENLNWYADEDQDSGAMWVNASRDDSVAVSLITNGGQSGGMVWQSLSYAYGKRPGVPLYSVNSDPANPSTLIVTVTHASGDEGRPETFKLAAVRADKLADPSTCQTNAHLQNYPVDFAKTELIVKDLLPGTEYVVCMKSGNTVGDSTFGRAVVIRTSSYKGDVSEGYVPEIIVGVLGPVVFFVLLVLCIVCCRRKIKSVKMNNRIEDPEMNFDRFDRIIYQQQNGVIMHDRKFGDKDDDLTKSDHKDSGTESGNASSISSQDQEDTDKGLVRDRRWSSVSNDSSSSQVHARRRHSSSGLSGYLRVDGDTSGVSVENERDSLIDHGAGHVDDSDEQGETNEYFDGVERFARHYEEIDDRPHETDTENTDKTTKLPKAVQHESSTYIGNSPPLARLNTGYDISYDQGGNVIKETSFEDMSTDLSANPKDNSYVPNENANTQSTLITKSSPYLDNHLDINSLQVTPLSNEDNSSRCSPQCRYESESVFKNQDNANENDVNVQNNDGDKGFEVDLVDSNKCNINESSATLQNPLTENQVENEYESNTEDRRSTSKNQLIHPPVEEINSSGATFDELTSGKFRVEELEDSGGSIMTSNFDNYQAIDKISLGQGSSLSGYIDTCTYKNNQDICYTDDENDLPNDNAIADCVDNDGQTISKSGKHSFRFNDENHDTLEEATDNTLILNVTKKNGCLVPIEEGKHLKSLIETISVPHESLAEASMESEKVMNENKSVNSNSYDSYVCAGDVMQTTVLGS